MTGPAAPTPAVRRVMQGNVSADTVPERVLRGALHRAGLRFRKHTRPASDVRCTADAVFAGARVVVFVDGCFWHGCPEHFREPRANAGWWMAKIAGNRDRDARRTRQLRARGWSVIRVWEHEVRGASLASVVERVRRRVARRLVSRRSRRPRA